MKKFIFFGIVLGFFVAILVAKPSVIINLFNNKKPDINLLKDITIENLKIGDVSYKFNYGKIERKDNKWIFQNEKEKAMRLAFFYQWTLEDPLFTVPYFDVEGFNKSIQNLEFIENKYNSVIKREERFFPLNFLRQIPEVYLAEDKFIKDPSELNAENLINWYSIAADSYLSDSKIFLNVVNNYKGNTPLIQFRAFNSNTTSTIVYSDIEKVSNNADALSTEILSRKNCLEKGEGCKRPIISFKKPDTIKPLDEAVDSTLPVNVLFPGESKEEIASISGPYIVTTSCYGWDRDFNLKPQIFYLINTKTIQIDGGNAPSHYKRIKLATDNYYTQVKKEEFRPDYNTDLPFIGVREDNIYTCRDMTHQSELMVLDYFWKNFRSHPIFKDTDFQNLNSSDRDFFTRAQKFEEAFFNSHIPSYKNLEILASYYGYAYKILNQRQFENMKGELLSRYLFITRKVSQVGEVITKGASSFSVFAIKEENYPGSTSEMKNFFFPQMYLSRSFWSYLYFPFSFSFYRNKDVLVYMEKKKQENIGYGKVYLDYGMMLQKFPPETIKKMDELEYEFRLR